MKSIQDIIAEVNAAKLAIKSLAQAARVEAPKGQKMAYGQHAAAEKTGELAKATLEIAMSRGFAPAAVSARESKSGRVEFVVTYREAQTLAQRIAVHENAAMRRKAKRDAIKAAKEAAAKAKVVAMPATPATDALSALAASLPVAKAA
jgi:hypothetical protein